MSETELSPERVQELLGDGAQVVDVREAYEHDAGHIPGTPRIGFEGLSAAAGELDRDRPLVFYCRVGSRSAVAVDAFRGSGFDAYNLAGGLVAWCASGLPLEPEGGEVAAH